MAASINSPPTMFGAGAASATPASLFNDRLATDPGGALVTFYDDATGERAELSAKSCANWVTKTYFLLVDELGLAPGDRAMVLLPVHWLAVPILFGCWFAGLEVVTEPAAATDSAVAFGDPESLSTLPATALTGIDEVYAVSMLSMGRPGVPPAAMQDYATSVRPQPDSWGQVRPLAAADAPALDGLTGAAVVEAAQQRAVDLGLEPGGRLLWTKEPDWLSAVLAPLAVGGSTVLVRHPDPAHIKRRAAMERATAVC